MASIIKLMLIFCVPAAMAAVLTKDYCVIGAGPSGKMFDFILYFYFRLLVVSIKPIYFSLCQKWCSNLHHIIVVNMKRLYFPQKVPSFSILYGKNAVLVGYLVTPLCIITYHYANNFEVLHSNNNYAKIIIKQLGR